MLLGLWEISLLETTLGFLLLNSAKIFSCAEFTKIVAVLLNLVHWCFHHQVRCHSFYTINKPNWHLRILYYHVTCKILTLVLHFICEELYPTWINTTKFLIVHIHCRCQCLLTHCISVLDPCELSSLSHEAWYLALCHANNDLCLIGM